MGVLWGETWSWRPSLTPADPGISSEGGRGESGRLGVGPLSEHSWGASRTDRVLGESVEGAGTEAKWVLFSL